MHCDSPAARSSSSKVKREKLLDLLACGRACEDCSQLLASLERSGSM